MKADKITFGKLARVDSGSLPILAARPVTSLALSNQEQRELADLESRIRKGLKAFMEVSAALWAVREKRLYRHEFATFEEYCRVKWDMTARRARQILAGGEVVKVLAADGNNCSAPEDLPQTESQARPLVGLEPEEQRAAWREAKATAAAAGQQVTAKHVQEAASRRKSSKGLDISEPDRMPPISAARKASQRQEESEDRPRVQSADMEGMFKKASAANEVSLVMGTKAERIQTLAVYARTNLRALQDLLGTPDSTAAAHVYRALEHVEAFERHMERTERLQAARKNPRRVGDFGRGT